MGKKQDERAYHRERTEKNVSFSPFKLIAVRGQRHAGREREISVVMRARSVEASLSDYWASCLRRDTIRTYTYSILFSRSLCVTFKVKREKERIRKEWIVSLERKWFLTNVDLLVLSISSNTMGESCKNDKTYFRRRRMEPNGLNLMFLIMFFSHRRANSPGELRRSRGPILCICINVLLLSVNI